MFPGEEVGPGSPGRGHLCVCNGIGGVCWDWVSCVGEVAAPSPRTLQASERCMIALLEAHRFPALLEAPLVATITHLS